MAAPFEGSEEQHECRLVAMFDVFWQFWVLVLHFLDDLLG